MAACIKAECDSDSSIDALLTPLEFVCRIAGTPVSQSALDNARNMISAEPVTTTVFAPSPSLTTVTTTEDGKNIVIVYPVTAPANNGDESQQATVTRFPPGTTVTETRLDGEEAQTTIVPVIAVSVDNDGSSHTTTQSETRTVTATATGSLNPTDTAEDTTLTTSVGTATTTASESATGIASDDQADTTSTVTSADATTIAETTDGANGNADSNPGGGDNGAPYGTPQGDATNLVPSAAAAFVVAVVFAGLIY